MKITTDSNAANIKCSDCGNDFSPSECIVAQVSTKFKKVSKILHSRFIFRSNTKDVSIKMYNDIHFKFGGICEHCLKEFYSKKRKIGIRDFIIGLILCLIGIILKIVFQGFVGIIGIVLIGISLFIILSGIIDLSSDMTRKLKRLTGDNRQQYLSEIFSTFLRFESPYKENSNKLKIYSTRYWKIIQKSAEYNENIEFYWRNKI